MVLPHNANIPVFDTNGKLILGPFNENGPTDVTYINHYRNKTYEDYSLRCVRGRADCGLTSKISEWENEMFDNIDTLDINALNFMYEN